MKTLLLAILLTCASCAHYQFGTTLPADSRSIEVAAVENLTPEPQLEALLRNALAESVMNTPGVSLATPSSPSAAILVTRVLELDQGRAARARLRERHDEDDSGKTYQTVVFRITVKVEYRAVAADGTELHSGSITATADYPTMPDLETGRGEALREAMRSAASQIIAEVTEG